MPAFFENPLESSANMTIKIFAPPSTGENDISKEDGFFNYYYTLEKLPKIRILTAPAETSRDRKDL